MKEYSYPKLETMSVDSLTELRESQNERYRELRRNERPARGLSNSIVTVAENLDRIEAILEEKGAF